MLKRLSILSILIISGCSYGVDTDTANSVANEITYSKDNRTGLCFGSISSTIKAGYSVISTTNVPCEKVEAFITQPKNNK